MAKKKKGPKRRRRVGAALNPSSPIVKIGAVAAGYFLGDKINEQIDKVTKSKVDTKIVGAGQVGIGALLLLSKGRAGLIKSVAGGLSAGSGLKRLMAAFGTPATTVPAAAVTGYARVPVLGSVYNSRLGGYQNVPVLGGVGGYNAGGTLAGRMGDYRINSGRIMGSMGSDLLGGN